jgi:catechol 2,3-dioxygenase-like lactoylglutathione lyase family enzyme
MQLTSILETCLYVDDLAAAQLFYRDTLGLEVVEYHPPRHLFLRCGKQMLLLFRPDQSSAPGELPPHGSVGSGHMAFGVTTAELAAWQQQLAAAGVEIEKVMHWPRGGSSFYFRDPAGNSLEIAVPQIWGWT